MEEEELFATARMARLTLMEDEVERLRQAVEQMLGYFSHMKSVDVSALRPTTHASFSEVLREDRESATASHDCEILLENAPEREDRFIVIPNVL